MKQNRALRVIKHLQNAPNRTLTLFQLEELMVTDWPPRAINEARKIPGVVIEGNNPYTLVQTPEKVFSKPAKPEVKKPIRYEYVGNTCYPIYQ